MKEKSTYNWGSKQFIKQPDFSFLNQGMFVWVINWLKTPPHLGMSYNGRYYSVTIHESQVDKPIEGLIRLFEQKSKPVFFVEIAHTIYTNQQVMNDAFSVELDNSTTCIAPINKVLFGDHFRFDTIAQLLRELEQQNLIQHIHIPWYENSEEVTIESYTKSEVIAFIESKKNDYAPSC